MCHCPPVTFAGGPTAEEIAECRRASRGITHPIVTLEDIKRIMKELGVKTHMVEIGDCDCPECQERALSISFEACEAPRNFHCSNCGDTRGGPVGHEVSECTWRGRAG